MKRTRGPAGGAAAGLETLFEEVVALYLRLRAAAALIHGQGELSGARRTVLRLLARSGPQSVSQLARTRSESRQRVQPLTTALAHDGFVEFVDNPGHKRSPLVCLTLRGRAAVEAIARREARFRARLPARVRARDLWLAADVLRATRAAIESERARRLMDALGRRRRSGSPGPGPRSARPRTPARRARPRRGR
jgi:DNA-binding MarR family transcriptional regulator